MREDSNRDLIGMLSQSTIFGSLTVLLAYLAFKHQTLKTSSELQEAIENRLQPKYAIEEPLNSQMLPHTDWPSEDIYFEVWHVEVAETRWMKWKKWFPLGSFRGRTIVQYKLYGQELPSIENLQNHLLAIQPYVESIRKDVHDSSKIKVIYDSVDPSNISLFARQFRYLIRDTTFYHLNPDADLQHEFVSDEDGQVYARVFDANASEDLEEKGIK